MLILRILIFTVVVIFLLLALPVEAETPTIEYVAPVLTTEETIREYFKDIPIMIEVSRCESQFRQFNKDGTVLKGVVDNRDTGAMQINTYYHLSDAQKLGLDIFTLEGNLAYARYLYERQGTQPWNASSKCWSKNREVVV